MMRPHKMNVTRKQIRKVSIPVYKKHNCKGLKAAGLRIYGDWLHIPKIGADPPMPDFTQVHIKFCPYCGGQLEIKRIETTKWMF